MPELPEVETVKNGLRNIYLNKIIDNVIVNHNNIIANIDVDLFKSKLINQEILSFNRSPNNKRNTKISTLIPSNH